MHIESLVKVFDVRINGLARQAKHPGDLSLALAGHETTGDLAQARRKPKRLADGRPGFVTESPTFRAASSVAWNRFSRMPRLSSRFR